VAVRILTIPFDPAKQLFPDDELNRFLLSKHVKEMRAAFFQMDSRPYWTVYIEYDPVLEETREPEEGLSEAQRLLFQRLREWRKDKADREGIPVFIIAKNSQLVQIVRRAPMTLEALRQIDGFGKKKMERHGKEIIDILRAFYEKPSGSLQERKGRFPTDGDAPDSASEQGT